MEFSYYFNNSHIESSRLAAFWEYPATSYGNFTVNNPTVGSFPSTQVINDQFDIGDAEDFSIFITFHSYVVASPEEFRFRTQILFSNSTGTEGWDFGILASNMLFVSTPTKEIYCFDNIWLGEKNCICIQKAGQSFTIYQYDVKSDRIINEQSISFRTGTSLLSGPIFIAYNEDTNVDAYTYSWYGVVDQLAIITEAIDRSTVAYLLQGFRPTAIVETTTNSLFLHDYSWRPDLAEIPSIYLDVCQPIINDVVNRANSLSSGAYYGSLTVHAHATITGGMSLSTAINSCYSSGTASLMSYSSTSGLVDGMSGSGYYFDDTVRVNKYRAGDLVNYSDELLISHNFTIGYSGGELYKFAYDSLYKVGYEETSTALSIDTSYYTGFYMDGVSVKVNTSNVTLLGHLSGAAPNEVGIIGSFDSVSKRFKVTDAGAYYYYNGLKVPTADIDYSGDYIDITTVTETNSDEFVYDLYGDLILLSLGLSGCATGRFYPMTCVPYSGENSYDIMYRIYPNDYVETSKLHMFHGMPVLRKYDDSEHNNLDKYWS